MKKHAFNLTVTSDNESGEILGVYFRVRMGKVAKTKEFAEGAAFADYGIKGELLGIELLEPCEIAVLDKITVKDTQAKKFVKNSIPRGLVAGST